MNPMDRADCDRSALKRMKQGDGEALKVLFRNNASILMRFLTRCGLTSAVAEVRLQETFLEAWREAAQYRPTQNTPRGWLFEIAWQRARGRAMEPQPALDAQCLRPCDSKRLRQ